MDVVDLPHSDKGPRGALPVVLLHGFPLDHALWAPQARALEAAGARVVAPDLRGLGKAPVGKAPATMAAMAGDVLRLAERAGLRRFALAGFSMGGYVALEVVKQAPDRVAGLALVDSKMTADAPQAREGRYQTIEKVKAQGVGVVAEAMLPKLLTSAAPPDLVERVRATMMAQRVEGVVGALQAMAERADHSATLAALRVPALVVVGDQDALTTPADAEAMARALPDARLVVVKGAAHLTTLERADDVSAAMVEWYARVARWP